MHTDLRRSAAYMIPIQNADHALCASKERCLCIDTICAVICHAESALPLVLHCVLPVNQRSSRLDTQCFRACIRYSQLKHCAMLLRTWPESNCLLQLKTRVSFASERIRISAITVVVTTRVLRVRERSDPMTLVRHAERQHPPKTTVARVVIANWMLHLPRTWPWSHAVICSALVAHAQC